MKRISQILIIVLLLVTAAVGVYLNLEEEEVPFGVDYVKNMKIDVYCPVQFNNGHFSSSSFQEECPGSGVDDLSARLFNLKEVGGRVFGVLERETEDLEWFLIGVNEDGVFAMKKVDDKPEGLIYEDNLFKLKPQGSEYLLVNDDFIEINRNHRSLSSPKYGFSIKIPENWSYKKEGGRYTFFNPEVDDYYLEIDLSDFSVNYVLPQDIPYSLEMKAIESSLKFNRIDNFSDYRFFRDGLEDYLEVNTVTEEIVYHQGEERHQFSVLASGDFKTWNGTPSGLYELISKEGLRFSTESEVYMPFSMRLYGKYLIHGEAYYPSGLPYTSAVSGGCVRVRNEEMADLYDLVEAGIPVLSITHEKETFSVYESQLNKKPTPEAESFLVVDIDSGKVFSGKNFNKLINVDDLSKLMKAIVTTEQLGVTTPITARDYMLGKDDTNADIRAGMTYRLVDLLAPLLVEHSDNAARVISHYVGRDNTISYMRQKADSLGMKDTHFGNIFNNEDSITTAEDLYYLLYYLTTTRRPILEITKSGWVPHINYEAFHGLKSQNVFYDRDYFSGGFFEVNEDGLHNGIFLFDIDMDESREVAFIMLGVPTEAQLIEDIENLKSWLEKSFN